MEPHSAAETPGSLRGLGTRVAVLGAGRVGSAAATLLREAGFEIAAVTTRASEATDAGNASPASGTGNTSAAAAADIVLVTTNDDAIASVVAEVASAGGFRAGQLVVHMSGALPLAVLAPAADAGALVGCLHPLQSFATAEDAVRTLPGSVFGITAGPGAAEPIEQLVAVLGGQAVVVGDDHKALYHAAAVMASNYLVAVEDMAVHLLTSAGFDEPSALQALQPLATGTLGNVGRLGTTTALTGPIARGDADTVRGHIEALRRLPGDELALYRALGRHTLDIAIRRGTLTAEQTAALRELLAAD